MDSITITLRKIGNSLGFILPKEAANLIQASEGDELTLTQSPEGLLLTPYDPQFSKKMEISDSILSRYKNALRELAK